MPTTCDVDAFYLGSVGPLTKLYAGTVQVWPCFECLTDPEYIQPQYADALMYLPSVCTPQTPGAGYRIYEAVSNLDLTQGDGYNGVYATTLDFETWGFNPPITADIGEIVVEAELTALSGIVGVTTSTVSFYIEISEEIAVEDEGILLEVEDLEISIVGSVFLGTTIHALVPDGLGSFEITAETDLALDTETLVSVEYNLTETTKQLKIYFDGSVVGEIEEPV